MGGTIVGDSGPRTGERGRFNGARKIGRKARPTMLILHSMPDEPERIRALLERQPADLRVAVGKPTPAQVRQPKLPVEIHGERVFVDDEGTWYAASSAVAGRLQNVLDGITGGGGGPLPLEMAEAHARAVVKRLGGGRLLFTANWSKSAYRYPPGAKAIGG